MDLVTWLLNKQVILHRQASLRTCPN
jgi:hypothetical protein